MGRMIAIADEAALCKEFRMVKLGLTRNSQK